MSNLFVRAYMRNKRSQRFILDFERQILFGSRPLIRTGKIHFEKDFKPISYLKPHIFINDGK